MDDLKKPLNAYEQKQADRKARLEARAELTSAASLATFSQAKTMASYIPFGQPILIGHHSERRDRNFRSKIHGTYKKSFAMAEEAERLQRKAEGVGKGGISRDDPDAVSKLRKELENCERSQEVMKNANKIIRKNVDNDVKIAQLVGLGLSENQANELLKPDFAGRVGFASYSLTNNNANIARIKLRIAELEKLAERVTVEEVNELYEYREDAEEKRVMFIFNGKPDESTRAILKKYAFKWSPSRGAWVRQITNAALFAAKQVKKELANLTTN